MQVKQALADEQDRQGAVQLVHTTGSWLVSGYMESGHADTQVLLLYR